MTSSENPVEQFRALVADWGRSADHVDLIEGALLIAAAEYDGLDRAACRESLERLGEEAAGSCKGDTVERLTALRGLMFERWGFRGNDSDYYDPRNSFLNDVLERRTGIPITLSLVTIEVGRGAGLDLEGIGMPGHFLVGVVGRDDLFVDPFHGGELLTKDDCVKRLGTFLPGAPFREEYLSASPPRNILARILQNLLGIFLRKRPHERALPLMDMMLAVAPDRPEWLLRRAIVNEGLERIERAIGDLEEYVDRCRDEAGREEGLRRLSVLHQRRLSRGA